MKLMEKLLASLLAPALAALAPDASAAGISGQGTWETTLQARDLDGNGSADAFYDTVLDITWLRNANINGAMTHPDAIRWAAALDFGGYTGWRLPSMMDTGAFGCDVVNYAGGTDCGYYVQTGSSTTTVFSEIASLWYDTLGNKGYCPPGGDPQSCVGGGQGNWGLTNTGDFSNLESGSPGNTAHYWFGQPGLTNRPLNRWRFNTFYGYQDIEHVSNTHFAFAVRSGDTGVALVPEPNQQAMVLAGLVLLGVLARRQLPRTSSDV